MRARMPKRNVITEKSGKSICRTDYDDGKSIPPRMPPPNPPVPVIAPAIVLVRLMAAVAASSAVE